MLFSNAVQFLEFILRVSLLREGFFLQVKDRNIYPPLYYFQCQVEVIDFSSMQRSDLLAQPQSLLLKSVVEPSTRFK